VHISAPRTSRFAGLSVIKVVALRTEIPTNNFKGVRKMAVQMKRRVGILGATGTVGQRLIHMLRDHPYFEVTALAASDRSDGNRFADVCNWKLPFEMPEAAKDIKVFGCKPPLDCDLVISSLPSDIAVE